MIEETELNVKGMSCDGCAKGIIAALRFVPGVKDVEARYVDGKVLIKYDARQVQAATLRSEIEALEYEVVE
ncbi:MAG: heavy-metal-associated domain-containing protein [Candidatus Velthaea sp.]